MTAKELVEILQRLPPDTIMRDDDRRNIIRVKDDGTIVMDRCGDDH